MSRKIESIALELQRKLDGRLSPMQKSAEISRLRDLAELHPERAAGLRARIAQLEDTMNDLTAADNTAHYAAAQKRHDDLRATVEVATAFGGRVHPDQVPQFLRDVHAVIASLGVAPAAPEKALGELVPAVPIRKSVTPDYIVCLEDGQKFRSLKRHLGVLGMTPEQYREKWGLPADYPMVAPAYSAKRSELAKASGLGRKS